MGCRTRIKYRDHKEFLATHTNRRDFLDKQYYNWLSNGNVDGKAYSVFKRPPYSNIERSEEDNV